MIIVKRGVSEPTPGDGGAVDGGGIGVVVVPRQQLEVSLVGADGSVWDLINGPVRLQSGASGFHTPDPLHFWRDSPALDGSSWDGMRTPAGEPLLPVRIGEGVKSSLEWRDVHAAFETALDAEGECSYVVTTPDGRTRRLGLRFKGGLDIDTDIDPLLLLHAVFPLEFTAGDPYWRGDTISTEFEAVDPSAWFPGPPFYVNPGNAIATARVSNPGHVGAFPRWTITGPLTAVTVGVGDSVVTIEATLSAGEQRIIDMDPRLRTIVDENGADAWLDATDAAFAAIPAGADVALNLEVIGPGSGTEIALEFTPGYRQAW